jgi:hypothetical protein
MSAAEQRRAANCWYELSGHSPKWAYMANICKILLSQQRDSEPKIFGETTVPLRSRPRFSHSLEGAVTLVDRCLERDFGILKWLSSAV